MRRKKEKVVYEEDDGRTVADMNVEGMPWYRKDPQNTSGQIESMSSPEGKAALSGALLAVFVAVGLFVGVFALFILFTQYIWLK